MAIIVVNASSERDSVICCVALRRNWRTKDGEEAKKSTRGRKQDRARVAGGQDYEVQYTAKKSRNSASAVKKAVKKVGSSRKRVMKALRGKNQ